MAASDVDSLMALYDTAIADGDGAAAESYARRALGRLAALSDNDFSGASMRWDRRTINDAIKEARLMKSATAGIQVTKLVRSVISD